MAEFGKCLFGCLPSFYEKSKPTLAMIIVQFCFAGLNILSKIALNQGMSHYVLVFYRHLFATIVTAPVAYILERRTRPKLTIRIFGEIFICSLFGISLNMNFYYTGLSYTTATFSTALLNLVPAITFLMAIVFRMERLSIRSLASQAKIVGTLVCVSGAMTMTFYRGIKIQLWPSPFNLSQYTKSNTTTEDLTKGSLLVVMGCICFSTWFILQGIIASGVAFCLMAWCIEKKGPVFTTMFAPLVLVIVALFGSILLDEKFYLGSIIGAILIVIGLYIMLWSKSKEMEKIVKIPGSKESNNVEQKEDLINI